MVHYVNKLQDEFENLGGKTSITYINNRARQEFVMPTVIDNNLERLQREMDSVTRPTKKDNILSMFPCYKQKLTQEQDLKKKIVMAKMIAYKESIPSYKKCLYLKDILESVEEAKFHGFDVSDALRIPVLEKQFVSYGGIIENLSKSKAQENNFYALPEVTSPQIKALEEQIETQSRIIGNIATNTSIFRSETKRRILLDTHFKQKYALEKKLEAEKSKDPNYLGARVTHSLLMSLRAYEKYMGTSKKTASQSELLDD